MPAGWFGKGVGAVFGKPGMPGSIWMYHADRVVHEASDRTRYPRLFADGKGPKFRIAYGLG